MLGIETGEPVVDADQTHAVGQGATLRGDGGGRRQHHRRDESVTPERIRELVGESIANRLLGEQGVIDATETVESQRRQAEAQRVSDDDRTHEHSRGNRRRGDDRQVHSPVMNQASKHWPSRSSSRREKRSARS